MNSKPFGIFGNNIALARTALLVVLLIVWEIYARTSGNSAIFPPVSWVILSLGTDIFSDVQVTRAILLALVEIAIAYALSVIVGFALGVAIGFTDFARKGVMPVVLLLYAVPQVIILPLFVLVFGIGPVSKVAFGFSHGVFPVLLATVAGMRNTTPLLLSSARSQGASRLQTIRHVIFPNMVPSVFAGMRLAMTVTLLGVLLAELFVSENGIGYFAQAFGQKYDPSPLFALIVILAVMAVGLNELVRLIERRFSHWKN
jgi:NitT/TauT family transport system permease protein